MFLAIGLSSELRHCGVVEPLGKSWQFCSIEKRARVSNVHVGLTGMYADLSNMCQLHRGAVASDYCSSR